MSDWIRGTVEAIGWPLCDRLKGTGREVVPDKITIFGSNRDWRFEVVVRFIPVEEMDESELNELFGLEEQL